jgi:hypothetical protein
MTAADVDVIIQVAARDPSIARVLREICALEPGVRASALDLVAAHLRTRSAGADVLACVAALRRDEIARRIAEALGPPA